MTFLLIKADNNNAVSHPAIIAGRIRFEQNNYKLLSRHVGNKEIRKHFADSFTAETYKKG